MPVNNNKLSLKPFVYGGRTGRNAICYGIHSSNSYPLSYIVELRSQSRQAVDVSRNMSQSKMICHRADD